MAKGRKNARKTTRKKNILTLLELRFAEPDQAKKFNCKTCPDAVKKLRRCAENKEFTSEDSNVFPIRIFEGGTLYGHCPAKATWNHKSILMFNALIVTLETGLGWVAGGLTDQPSWWLDLCAEFFIKYDDFKFNSRAKAILGDGKDNKTKAVKPHFNKRV